MASDQLHTYMNDHLAGALAGVTILERLIAATEEAAEQQALGDLLVEIQEDRGTLQYLLERSGGHRSAWRKASGWVGATATAVKLRMDDPGGHRLSRFEALEMLALGILGKRALWRALAALGPGVPALHGVDFRLLEQRARDQHDRVDARRLALGRTIFT
jgi:hypothetical protein